MCWRCLDHKRATGAVFENTMAGSAVEPLEGVSCFSAQSMRRGVAILPPDSKLMRRVIEERWVEVRPPTTHGKGVFARHPLSARTCIGVYRGEVITPAQLNRRYRVAESVYAMTVQTCVGCKHPIVVDAADPARGNWTRFINSCAGTGRPRNCTFTTTGRVMTRRRIEAGEELLVSYGRSYDGFIRAQRANPTRLPDPRA